MATSHFLKITLAAKEKAGPNKGPALRPNSRLESADRYWGIAPQRHQKQHVALIVLAAFSIPDRISILSIPGIPGKCADNPVLLLDAAGCPCPGILHMGVTCVKWIAPLFNKSDKTGGNLALCRRIFFIIFTDIFFLKYWHFFSPGQ